MSSLQQVIEQLALLAAQGDNSTTSSHATSTFSAPRGPIELLVTIFKMLFSASALRDWAILLVVGSSFEMARRLLSSTWSALLNAFFLTAVFEEDDVSFQWIMLWLSKQPSWKGARNVQISTSNFDLHAVQYDQEEPKPSTHERKVTYLPAVSESYTLWYKWHWMGVTRSVETHRNGWSTREKLTISIMSRNHGILAGILQDAKNEYIEAQKDKISIFISDRFQSGCWRELATRPKRPLNSIILDPGIAELVVEDVQDFLSSKEWYAERGIPFRRGYLLYGAPGSGKTSLIHGIAGELGLNVYIVSLSRSGLDDTGLAELISALPERCIALMEDVDAAFHHGLSREPPEASWTPKSDSSERSEQRNDHEQNAPPSPNGNRVSLSGLLNALDGIGAQEGRVLFATTNKYSSLDPALCRPGRMDLHIEFKLASQLQAEELFKRFYSLSSSPSTDAGHSPSKHDKMSKKCKNGHADVNAREAAHEKDLIDLSDVQSQTQSPPPSSSPPSPFHARSLSEGSSSEQPTYVGIVHKGRSSTLSHERIDTLAAQFALAVPERQLSMASLQGFLMMHKTRPFVAVAEAAAWVEKELAERRRREKGEKEGEGVEVRTPEA